MADIKKYSIIYADPPWQFSNSKTGGSLKSSAQSKYMTTSIEDLKAMDVNSLAADDALLVMWWVGSMPQEAIDLVNAWGFTLKNMNGIVWNKLTKNNNPHFGMGFLHTSWFRIMPYCNKRQIQTSIKIGKSCL